MTENKNRKPKQKYEPPFNMVKDELSGQRYFLYEPGNPPRPVNQDRFEYAWKSWWQRFQHQYPKED